VRMSSVRFQRTLVDVPIAPARRGAARSRTSTAAAAATRKVSLVLWLCENPYLHRQRVFCHCLHSVQATQAVPVRHSLGLENLPTEGDHAHTGPRRHIQRRRTYDV
jgi:hypothetical protein